MLAVCFTRPARTFAVAFVAIAAGLASAVAEPGYAWRGASVTPAAETLAQRIAPPPGFERPAATPASFAAWLRGLPLKPPGSPVLLYTGAPKFRQDVHV